jgi:hypothetical protein
MLSGPTGAPGMPGWALMVTIFSLFCLVRR